MSNLVDEGCASSLEHFDAAYWEPTEPVEAGNQWRPDGITLPQWTPEGPFDWSSAFESFDSNYVPWPQHLGHFDIGHNPSGMAFEPQARAPSSEIRWFDDSGNLLNFDTLPTQCLETSCSQPPSLVHSPRWTPQSSPLPDHSTSPRLATPRNNVSHEFESSCWNSTSPVMAEDCFLETALHQQTTLLPPMSEVSTTPWGPRTMEIIPSEYLHKYIPPNHAGGTSKAPSIIGKRNTRGVPKARLGRFRSTGYVWKAPTKPSEDLYEQNIQTVPQESLHAAKSDSDTMSNHWSPSVEQGESVPSYASEATRSTDLCATVFPEPNIGNWSRLDAFTSTSRSKSVSPGSLRSSPYGVHDTTDQFQLSLRRTIVWRWNNKRLSDQDVEMQTQWKSLLIPTVGKITGEILAPGETMTKEARDILIDCCVEFITMISSEANDTMEREAKKTIAPEHVAAALKELGFPEYINEVLASANDQKEQLKTREKRTTKMEQSGMSQEELEEAQKALFAQATEKYTNNQ